MAKIETELRTELVNEIREFKEELGKGNGLQHISTEAFAEIVRDYASALIDKHIRLPATYNWQIK